MKRYIIVILVFLSAATSIHAQSVLLKNCKVHQADLVWENSDIFIENGIIKDIGENLKVNAEVERIDLKGKDVYPGFINAFSQLGINEVGAVWQTNDLGEDEMFNPNINAFNAINTESPYIAVARSNGILLTVVAPTKGLIPGQTTLINTTGWNWEESNRKKSVSMLINFSGALNAWFSPEITLDSHIEQVTKIENFMQQSLSYKKAVNSNTKGTIYKKSLVYEAMIPVLEKQVPVWIVANSSVEIQSAIAFSKKYDLKIVIVGGNESYLMADQLKSYNIPVILTNVFSVPTRKSNGFDAYYSLPFKLYQKGLKFCIAVKGNMNTRNLVFNAAKAASYGLPTDEAIKSISQYSAEIIGVDNFYGSIAIGKKANLLVVDGTPLEITNEIEMAIIDGEIVGLTDKHKNLYKKFKKRYKE